MKKATPSPWLTVDDLIASGLTLETAQGFLDHRKAKKAKLTALAWKGFTNEVAKTTGWTNEAAALKAIARNWTGFEASWVAESPRSAGGHVNKQQALEESNRAVGEAWLKRQQEQQGGQHEGQ